MEKLKLGIVGLGRLGIEYAKNISYSVHNAELFAACSIEKDEIEYVKNKFGVYNIYDSYDKMLKNKNIDAIIIVSPTDHHPDHIIKALESGFHVFCEKPLAISVSECYRVKKIVDKNKNKIAMLGFVRRYDKSYADAKIKLESGLVGKPFFIRSQTVDKDSYAPFQIEFCKSGGGIFHDFNVHDIDLVHWFSGVNIKKVWSLGGAYRFKEFGEKGDADNTYSMCELDNGSMALIGASRVSSFGHNTFTEIQATHGNLKIGDPPKKNLVQISDKYGIRHECFETFYDRFEKAFIYQIKDFINIIFERKKSNLTIDNALKATLVASAMTKSFNEKKVIRVEDLVI